MTQSKKQKHSCTEDPDFTALLRDAGLKATKPRLAIVSFLFHEHGPFTLDEIFQHLGARDMDLTTVYRTAQSLEKAGMLTRCEFRDGIARFEFKADGQMMEHHHHVICRKCKKVASIEFCLSEEWRSALAKMGYSDPDHTLEFFGICKTCQPKRRT